MSLFSFGEGAVDAWGSMAHALVNTPEIPLAGGEDQDGLRPRPTRWITGPAAFDAARDDSGSADPAAGCANKATARLNLGSTDSFGRGDLLGRHFEDHGAEVGATSAAEYAAATLQFLQQSQENGFPTLIGSNRSTRTYDPSTNYFAAFNADGTTKTFFTPTSPNYWNTQEGSQPTIIGGP